MKFTWTATMSTPALKYAIKVALGSDGQYIATPQETIYNFKMDRKVPRRGLLLVSWDGNNGSTVTAGILANQTETVHDFVVDAWLCGLRYDELNRQVGTDAETLKDVNIPFRDILPRVHFNDFVIGGWGISSMDLTSAMDLAKVMEPSGLIFRITVAKLFLR